MPAVLLVIFALLGFVLFVAVMSVLRAMRRNQTRNQAARESLQRAPQRCRCGYPLYQLSSIRCPECGRVAGFDATAEELGLTEEQLRLAKSRRDQRNRPTS